MTGREILAELAKPFSADDIEWRVDRSGETNGNKWIMVIPYVTNRAIQQRLDEVCGMGGRNTFLPAPNANGKAGCICRIEILVDGEWISREDGAPNTERFAIKGGLSDSMKRSAVNFGLGRYLYRLYGPHFAEIHPQGKHFSFLEFSGRKERVRWNAPKLPGWATPPTGAEGQHRDASTGSPPARRIKDVPSAPIKKRRTFPRSDDGWRKKVKEEFSSAGSAQDLIDQIDWVGSNFDKVGSAELLHELLALVPPGKFPDEEDRIAQTVKMYTGYHPTDAERHEQLEEFAGPPF